MTPRGSPSGPRPGHTRYLVTPELEGTRLDQALTVLSGLPRRQIRAHVGDGGLWLNHHPTRVLSRQMQIGDVLDLLETPAAAASATPPRQLGILLEDGHLLAIDKPAGVVTQPPRQRARGELTAHELAILQLAWRDGHRPQLLLFHRLDRMTSGVLLFARQHEAARSLTRAWTGGKVRKSYLAVVRGDPGGKPLAIEVPIAPDPLTPGRYRAHRKGKPARTEVRRLATSGSFAVCEVRPFTGRTHQVRVHLAHAGFPIAGDTMYGGHHDVPRPFLHARYLTLPHPSDRRAITIAAPIPADMAAFLAANGLTVAGGEV